MDKGGCMRKVHTERRRHVCAATIVAACLGAAAPPGARAIGIQFGDVTGSWDTTISYGMGWRVAGRDCRLVALADGGCGYGPNADDGDLNYGKGVYSKALHGVTELSLNYRDRFGIFVRGDGLYDFAVMDGTTERTPLTKEARDYVGSYGRLLDAFGFGRFDLGKMAAELRLGRQVVSWGESTFIQNGLNTVNHFDVSSLRVPGAELKDALLPDEMAVFNLQITKQLSTQALYLVKWHDTKPEPDGSYFSTNDAGTPGGSKVLLNFGEFSDLGTDFRPLGGPFIRDFQTIPRLPNQNAKDSGQFGVNFKLYLPSFGNGTELGLYFLNYHSRLPVVSFNTGTQAGIGNAFGAASAVGAAAQALAAGLPLAAAIQTGAAVGAGRAAAAGGNLSQATALQYATIGANTLLAGGNPATQAANIATAEYSRTQGYFEQFPENINLVGISFNTQLQFGTALQGEVTYHHRIPLQYDDVELVYASLTPFEAGLTALQGGQLPPSCLPGAGATLSRCNQFGLRAASSTITGWARKDLWQAQFTATQTFPNIMRASQLVLVFEAAADYVPDLEDKLSGGPNGVGLRYDGPGTNVSGNAALTAFQFGQLDPGYRFPGRFSWGYVLASRLEYPNVIGAWSLLPHLTWEHDVNGTSPGPGGNFVQGRHGLTAGLGANLLSKWELDVSYTQFGGAGPYNLLRDRDFVAASIKYSF